VGHDRGNLVDPHPAISSAAMAAPAAARRPFFMQIGWHAGCSGGIEMITL
jgi:hypothetical protein